MPDLLTSLQAELADHYHIERELGRGGMATVYLARDRKHNRLVAIKVLRAELGVGSGPQRFLREIQILARLQHPHILPLLDSGTLQAGGTLPYFVMPFVEGESLRARLERERQLPLDEAVRITREVATALGYAHDLGFVHRDIKPENILISGGQAVLADFGIARILTTASAEHLTETGLALGTPQYMSPEQVSGDAQLDGRTDIYALGCVLYEMLAGEPPYTGPTAQAIIARRMIDPVPNVRTVRETVPEGMERAISRALARSPADRFRTAPEFAEALTSGGTPQRPLPEMSRRWRIAAMALAVLVALGVALGLASRRGRRAVSPSASLIAVLPFTPSGTDTALSRLGRDLVFTLSAELDGLGDIRVVDAHTVLAHAGTDEPVTPAGGAEWARRFGAGSIVHGSLVREGRDVRLDFVMLSTDSGAPALARVSVANAPDSIAALTDSAVHSLLRQVWTRGTAPTPSLEAALKTRSAPALRAFLEGERQFVGGWWDSASASFARAREADPEFWLAYARELYAVEWSVQPPNDSLVELVRSHHFELPESERLIAEANELRSHDSIGRALDRARLVTERYPSAWFGWLDYADELLHNGPLLGHPRAEARTGFARALELHPNLIPVHEHLMLVAIQDRDTAAAARGLRELARLNAGPSLTADGYGNRMLQFRFLDGIIRGDTATTRVLADSIARDPAPKAVGDGSFYDPFRYRFPREQIRVSTQVLRDGGPPGRLLAHYHLLTFSWVARGAWDSALATMDRFDRSGLDSATALRSYGLAVVGAWLGAVDTSEVASRRPAAVRRATSPEDRAELAWLDGVAAVSRRDRRTLATARAALQHTGAAGAGALDSSLAAFDDALGGSTLAAGKALAELEWRQAALTAPAFAQHPYVIAVNRLAAAQWLGASGDADQALRLLTAVDGAYLLHPGANYVMMLSGLFDLERARVEERRGHDELARNYYREFMRIYDRPPAGHHHLVQEATDALVRVAPAG